MESLQLNNIPDLLIKIRQYFNKNEEARFIHKLQAILLKIDNSEHSCDSIAKLLGHSPRTISNWIKKINQTNDIESLRSKAITGKPERLSEIQNNEIREILQKPPEQCGVSANIWDGKSLSHYIQKEYNIILGVRQCQRLFRKLGFNLKRARPVVAKAVEAKKEVSKKTEIANKYR